MNKIPNRKAICDTLMEAARRIKILWCCAVIPGVPHP